MDFLPPFRRRFPALPSGSSPCISCRRSCGCQGAVARFCNKKSPHNNLNLTIPSGMALVRVRYVAIRKSKTCSGSFGSRAGTLSKYVILNCWNRLPQKTSFVNKKSENIRCFRQLARKRKRNFGKKRGWTVPAPLVGHNCAITAPISPWMQTDCRSISGGQTACP